MTNAELISRINANIKANGREQINGEELNFILRQILGLITDSGGVPYEGATQDLDLGEFGLDAKFVNVKGTGGSGHLGMKHQFSNPTAGGQETVVFAGADGEPRFKNDGNAVEQFASREWVNLQGFQNTPIVVNSNITAQNDTVYHVVANATFTDPTPVEGRGYVVFVRNGTATIGGNPFSTAGNFIYRLFHSGAWALYPFGNINSLSTIFNSAYVPKTRTINGLDLSENRTLTTANINDSTNRRYVTDAQATVIGNTSGTNTGDETQSSILSKLGWMLRKAIGSSTVTGTGETLVATFTINANELSANDMLRWFASSVKNGTAGQQQLRLKHSTSNDFTTADQIAIFNATTLANININVRRDAFTIESGQLSGFSFTTSAISDNTNNNNANNSKVFDVGIINYFFVTIQLTNGSDTARLRSSKLSNI